MTLLLTFSPSFFEQNVSVKLKLLRFSAIFVISKESQKCWTFSQNAGNKPKCGISRTIAGRLTPMGWLVGWQSCQVDLVEFLETFPSSPRADAIQWGGGVLAEFFRDLQLRIQMFTPHSVIFVGRETRTLF